MQNPGRYFLKHLRAPRRTQLMQNPGRYFLKHLRALLTRKRAVSPVVATILIFGLIIAGVVIGFTQVLPFIERAQTESALSSITAGFLGVDQAIQELIGAGDTGSGTFSPSRTVSINKPRGVLRVDMPGLLFNIDVYDQDGSPSLPDTRLGSALGTHVQGTPLTVIDLGRLQFEIQSPFDLLGGASRRYIKGPESTAPRSQVIVLPLAEVGSEYLELTNLTLSPGTLSRYFLNLDYRTKLSVDVDPTTPALSVRLYLICISGSMPDVIAPYKSLRISALTNITSWDLGPDSHSRFRFYYRISTDPGTSQLVFDTEDLLPGTDLSRFALQFQTVIYEVAFT